MTDHVYILTLSTPILTSHGLNAPQLDHGLVKQFIFLFSEESGRYGAMGVHRRAPRCAYVLVALLHHPPGWLPQQTSCHLAPSKHALCSKHVVFRKYKDPPHLNHIFHCLFNHQYTKVS